MPPKINVNGQVFDAADAVVPAMDRGFLYGDSIYETLCAYEGRVFKLSAHVERLARSGDALELELPLDEAAFGRRIAETIEAAGEHDAAVRLVVTRGVGEMDLQPDAAPRCNVLVYVRARPRQSAERREKGVPLAIVTRRRNPRRSLDPNVKSGNYLNSVLALMEARKSDAFEAVMLNADGAVTECSTSNIFLVEGGRVVTPELSCGLLSGITRRTLLDLCARDGIPFEERIVSPEELLEADEVFITSSIKQVMPATSIDGRPVGDGKVGPVSRRLQDLYRAEVAAETGVPPERQ